MSLIRTFLSIFSKTLGLTVSPKILADPFFFNQNDIFLNFENNVHQVSRIMKVPGDNFKEIGRD